jgi:hypothetical protein
MIKMLKRCAETAVKLPFSVAWDCISLGNMGEGSSTGKVLEEHEARKKLDDILEIIEKVKE